MIRKRAGKGAMKVAKLPGWPGTKLQSGLDLRIQTRMQKREWQCGLKIGPGFGQGHESVHIQLFGSRSRRKPDVVLENSVRQILETVLG